MAKPIPALVLENLLKLLKPRERDADKHDFGHVLIVGGDYGMAGAVRMAAEAAARIGTGLVSVATHPKHTTLIISNRPELMVHGITDPEELDPLLQRANAIVLGPGLGRSTWSHDLFQKTINHPSIKVIDADGLNLLSKSPQQRSDWILTPHAGEAARLLETSIANVKSARLEATAALQKIYGGTIVLKGSGTLIMGTNQQAKICKAGNPGMASGGMGDLLSGVIGGLLAQGLPKLTAAELGVMLHSTAGDLAAHDFGERGLLAMDLIPYLRKLINPKTSSIKHDYP